MQAFAEYWQRRRLAYRSPVNCTPCPILRVSDGITIPITPATPSERSALVFPMRLLLMPQQRKSILVAHLA